MTTLVSPPSSKIPHTILHSQKDDSETDAKKIRREKGEAGTETMDSTPRNPLEIKEEQEKVVYTNGFFSFIASPLRTGTLPFQNHATSYRSNLDSARDEKRILEICYQSDPVKMEKAIEPSPIEEGTTNSPVEDKKRDKEQKEKKEKKDKEKKSKKKKKKKSSKKYEKETKKPKTEDQSYSTSYFDTQEKKHQQLKDTTKTERLPLTETTKLSSKKTSNPQHANEKEANSVEKATSTNPSEGGEKEKKKAIVKRDKAGKVVRKPKKSKGRGRVVQPDCFRKGKDTKIGLATINEGFYDRLDAIDSDDDSSRITYDSWDCDEIWCTDHNFRSLPNSSDDDSELHSGDYGKSGKDDSVEVKKMEKIGLRRAIDQGKEVNKPNIFKRIMTKKLMKSSSSNYISSNSRQNNIVSRYTASHALNLTNTTIMTTESELNVKTDSSQDSESLEESIVSTCCTSTAYAREDDSTDGRCKCWCFRSKWTMMITGVLFVIVVAAVTFAVGYFSIFEDTFEDDEDESSPLVPIMEPRPNLRPSTKPSTDIIDIPPPTSILTTLSTSCYMPDDTPEIILVQAEDAPVINFAPIKSSSGGFCGDGYASLLPKVRAGFKFWSLEVESHGYYSVAIRYNNIDKGKILLGLIINDLDKGTFDLLYTENESSWLVVMVNNVLLHEGENSIRISVLDSDQEKGPNVDWLAVVLQKPLSKFDYLSGLVAESSGITSQTLLQTRTLQWMANEDTVDYSHVTDVEIIERYVLLQLYHYTAGDMWTTNDQWRSESHVCDWYGVNCSEEMIVTDLMLENNELMGYVPTDLSLLTNLVVLSLGHNSLQGTIPTEIGRLINLSNLHLNNNFFSGTMPSELSSLKELQFIDLRTNSLNGEIPEEFFSLDGLESVALGSNFLTGTLSTNVGQLGSLKDLDLQIGQLSGTIPSELGKLTLLTNLSLGYNRFTGQIPSELGLLEKLSLLDINSNRLTGVLPPELSLLEDTVIDYYGNRIFV